MTTFNRLMTRRKYVGEEPTTAQVTLNVNIDLIFDELGRKAMFNKTRRARAMKGAIVAHAKPLKAQP